MKSEVAFFKDKRGKASAANLIKLYRELGYTDEQIVEEMKKILAKRKPQPAALDAAQREGKEA